MELQNCGLPAITPLLDTYSTGDPRLTASLRGPAPVTSMDGPRPSIESIYRLIRFRFLTISSKMSYLAAIIILRLGAIACYMPVLLAIPIFVVFVFES